jgi:hypothetical protein
MEKEGYGMCDSLYYVKDEGEGLNGLALIDSNLKVEEMVRKYEHARKLVLTVMRDKRKLSIVVYPVKPFGRGRSPDDDEVDGHYPEHPLQTVSPVFPLQTQTDENEWAQEEAQQDEDDDGGEASDGSDSFLYPCNYYSVDAEEKRRKEAEELEKTMAELGRKRADPLEHCEGETDVEDIFDTPSVNYEDILSEMPVKKKPKR